VSKSIKTYKAQTNFKSCYDILILTKFDARYAQLIFVNFFKDLSPESNIRLSWARFGNFKNLAKIISSVQFYGK